MAPNFERIGRMGDKCLCAMSQSPVKEACAEFLGTFVLVVLGDSVMASCVLGRLHSNSLTVSAFGWGLAVMVAVAIAGGISGGHVNPAVTTGLASIKKCPLQHMVSYLIAQYVGSFFAAAVVYVIYIDAIDLYDGGVRQMLPSANSTAQIFATYPQDFASTVTCFLDQVVGTAILLIIICVATDSKNFNFPSHYQPMVIGLGIAAIIFAFGYNCGAPLNPARDLAPRIFTAISGWGKGVFSYRNYEWFWIPVIAPHIGGFVGAWLYKMLIAIPSENVDRTLHDGDNCMFPEGERQLNGLEVHVQNSAIDIPADDITYKSVIDKAVNDAKYVAETSLPSNLINQNV